MVLRVFGDEQPEPTPAERAEQERVLREQAKARFVAEQANRKAELERAELDRLRRGGQTARQQRAEERGQFLNLLAVGRWQPTSADGVIAATSTADARDAFRSVRDAAQRAVTETLAPLFDAAEVEIAAAKAERAKIISKGLQT